MLSRPSPPASVASLSLPLPLPRARLPRASGSAASGSVASAPSGSICSASATGSPPLPGRPPRKLEFGAPRARSRAARAATLPALDALEREREAPALGVDLDDLGADEIALRDDLARVLDVVLCELGDVHEALDAGHDLDEGAEGDDLRDLALDGVALVVALEHLLPGIGLRLLEAERDPLALAVDVEHLDLHVLADLEHLGRMVDVRPRELGDVDQAVHPVEVDEGAEVDDVRDLAVDHVARLEPVEDRLAHLLALVLEHGAAREHDVVARAVELDHLAAELLAEELVQVLDAADVDQRRRQEAAHAEVEDQAALDDLDHLAVDGLAGLGRRLDRLPGQLEAGALLGEDQPALGVLLRQHERVDLVAEVDLVGRIHRAPNRQLGDRDHALRLVADVDEHLVLVDADDGAVHDLALVDRREGRRRSRERARRPGRRPDAGLGRSMLALMVSLAIAVGQYSDARGVSRTVSSVPPRPARRPGVAGAGRRHSSPRSSRRRRRRRPRAAGRARRRRPSPRGRAS